MTTGSACVGLAPLFWKGMFFIIPFFFVVLAALGIYLVRHVYLNKKAKKKCFDLKTKISLLWFGVDFLSLVVYGIIGLDFTFYLLTLFIISMLILGGFYVGKRFRL